jgi:hypothetical protein
MALRSFAFSREAIMVSLQQPIDYREQRLSGFRPAFMDSRTCEIYLARLHDGRAASFHSTEGLPDAVVTRQPFTGRVVSVKPTLIPGFERNGFFYTCSAAVRATAEWGSR